MKRILIVDDAAFMRANIKNILERSDYQVVGEAQNGAVGVALYKELKPDMVTMDITMPEMTGLDALRQIKAFDPNAKVVMLSAISQEGMIKEAILSGAKTFIVKPFTPELLLQTLNKVDSI